MRRKFFSDIVQPWDELNSLLVERFAYQPDVCRATRLAGSLAVAIRHLPEALGEEQSSILSASQACRVMYDVGDAWKHGELKDSKRRNAMYVTADFEFSDDQYSYLRNAIIIQHAKYGKLDFMLESLSAIKFWLSKKSWTGTWSGKVGSADSIFYPEAFLYCDDRHSIQMDSTQWRFFKRQSGSMILTDPPVVHFAIYDVKDKN